VGRLEPEKGNVVLVRALAALRARGTVGFEAAILGGGQELDALRQLSAELGLADRVDLPGVVSMGPELFAYLDRADLFVLPSLTEGLPRALIEAMARGLPAIGSRTGGIPELLDDAQLVPAGDPDALADAIEALILDPRRLAELSRRNFTHAMNWRPDEMRRRKYAFWRCVGAVAETPSRVSCGAGGQGPDRKAV
jgi:glycosyltransferase involved in cell wall biosynthesis